MLNWGFCDWEESEVKMKSGSETQKSICDKFIYC